MVYNPHTNCKSGNTLQLKSNIWKHLSRLGIYLFMRSSHHVYKQQFGLVLWKKGKGRSLWLLLCYLGGTRGRDEGGIKLSPFPQVCQWLMCLEVNSSSISSMIYNIFWGLGKKRSFITQLVALQSSLREDRFPETVQLWPGFICTFPLCFIVVSSLWKNLKDLSPLTLKGFQHIYCTYTN